MRIDMKAKTVILAAMLAVAAGAQAQYGDEYYHRTGDTVYIRSEIGFYNWWEWEQLLADRDLFYMVADDLFRTTATPFFTPAPLRVVGIAGCPLVYPWGGDTTGVQEYFYLYDCEGDDMVYKGRLGWDLRDPHRTLIMPYNYPLGQNADSCCGSYFGELGVPLYEYYFDSAITVTDSFYVGFSCESQFHRNTIHPYTQYRYLGQWLSVTSNTDSCDEWDLTPYTYDPFGHVGVCHGAAPLSTIKFTIDSGLYQNPGGTYEWQYAPWGGVFLVYPLIEIDTTVPPTYMCDPVQNFQATVLDTGSGCVFFTWDDFYHYTYCEVQYFNMGQGYGSAVTTQVNGGGMLHVCGLDTMQTYYARVRAFCDTSKIETAWSEWVSFGFPHTDPPQGIAAEPTVLDRYTNIRPNPAADVVTVASELGLRRIEIHNARGILVYSEPAGSSATTIDLRGWPSGQYLVRIETPSGATTKRLVVAR